MALSDARLEHPRQQSNYWSAYRPTLASAGFTQHPEAKSELLAPCGNPTRIGVISEVRWAGRVEATPRYVLALRGPNVIARVHLRVRVRQIVSLRQTDGGFRYMSSKLRAWA